MLVVPVKINGKTFSAVIDSGATRCFVTRECCTVAGLSCESHDTFLELGNGTTALSPWNCAGSAYYHSQCDDKDGPYHIATPTRRDIVLGMNWLKYVNPIIDWCSSQVYLPGAVHTALLKGTWLSSEHAIGTVKILSNSVDIGDLQNDAI